MIYRSEVRDSTLSRLSEGFYTELDRAKAAVEEHYLSSGGNRTKMEKMCWIEVIPDTHRWINKKTGKWETPEGFSVQATVFGLEADEPMPIV